MAEAAPITLPGDLLSELDCLVCLEQKKLHFLTCGHRCCHGCIGKTSVYSNVNFYNNYWQEKVVVNL